MKKFFLRILVLGLISTSIMSCGKKTTKNDTHVVKSEITAKDSTTAEVVADSTGYIVKLGQVAPNFTIELTDGSHMTLDSLRGKVVMLQFTASWCGVCRKEMPFIEKDIWLKHKNNPNFALIGIDRDEPLDVVKAFAKSTGVTYPMG